MLTEALESLHEFTAQQPRILQILVLALVGAVPFLEAHAGSALGVILGVPILIAVLAAALGNAASCALAIWLTQRARTALVVRRDRAHATPEDPPAGGSVTASLPSPLQRIVTPKRMERFQRLMTTGGVPLVCLVAPSVMPTQATAATLVALGSAPRWVMGWITVSILFWGVAYALLARLGLALVL